MKSVFITGSNSCLLSGKRATKLAGHYVEVEMQALVFKEHEDMKAFLGKAANPNPVAEFDATTSLTNTLAGLSFYFATSTDKHVNTLEFMAEDGMF